MIIYAIEITTLNELSLNKIHETAFRSYDKAVNFIKHRNDNPEPVDDFTWKSDRYKYAIMQLNLQK